MPALRLAVVGFATAFLVSACGLANAASPDDPAAWPSPDVLATGPEPDPAATSAPAPPLGGGWSFSGLLAADPLGVVETAAEVAPAAVAEQKAPKRPKPEVEVIRLKPRPKPGPFRMNLYTKGDFMHQQTKDWCVAGSTQTMMNIIDRGKPNRSVAFQRRLYLQGRRLSPDKRKLGPIGIDLSGWAALLNTHGYGPYIVDGAGSRRAAIRRAARALRMTGKPVGLVTWRGAHSWVMSGFTATADPAYTKDFEVRTVNIQDVWYPYVSTIWGASRPPNASVPVAALAEDFLPYRRPRARYPKRDGKFMLILPTLPKDTIAR